MEDSAGVLWPGETGPQSPLPLLPSEKVSRPQQSGPLWLVTTRAGGEEACWQALRCRGAGPPLLPHASTPRWHGRGRVPAQLGKVVSGQRNSSLWALRRRLRPSPPPASVRFQALYELGLGLGALHPLRDGARPSSQAPSPAAGTAVEERRLGEGSCLGRERVGSMNPRTPPRAAPWRCPSRAESRVPAFFC